MKANEIINESDAKVIHDTDGECLVCKLHEKAQEVIPAGIKCPSCGHIHTFDEFFALSDVNEDDFTVVGGSNAYIPDENIEKYLTLECFNCGDVIALIPHKIIYNANHDIYYTGANQYLTKRISGILDAILPLIQNYTDRIKTGEDLNPINLAGWIDSEIEHLVAKYLYDNGFKK